MAKKEYQDFDLWIYLAAATLAVLATDTLKVVFAEKIRPILKPNNLSKIYRATGIILLLFGIRMLVHIFQ